MTFEMRVENGYRSLLRMHLCRVQPEEASRPRDVWKWRGGTRDLRTEADWPECHAGSPSSFAGRDHHFPVQCPHMPTRSYWSRQSRQLWYCWQCDSRRTARRSSHSEWCLGERCFVMRWVGIAGSLRSSKCWRSGATRYCYCRLR